MTGSHNNLVVASRTELLVLQVTPFCNIDCAYCYLPDRNRRKFIDEGVIAKTIERLSFDALLGEELDVLWHAGEPLVAGRELLARLMAIVDVSVPAGTRARHSIQTNGTLIDDDWCALFRDHHVDVGIRLCLAKRRREISDSLRTIPWTLFKPPRIGGWPTPDTV